MKKTEVYEHYATGELLELEIASEDKTNKVGYDKKTNKYYPILLDNEVRWKIKGTSFILKK